MTYRLLPFVVVLFFVGCAVKTQTRDQKVPEAPPKEADASAPASVTAAPEATPTSPAEKATLAPATFDSASVPKPVPAEDATEKTEAPTVLLVPKSVMAKNEAMAKSTEVNAPKAAAVVAPLPSFSKRKGTDPKTVLTWLKHGNHRFLKGGLRKDGQSKKDIQRLALGQQPHTIVISCSDSRVPPEIVFDQKLGELFVIRTAGESLDENVIASVEFALKQTNAKLILVMGHTSCGAVNAAIQATPGQDAGSPALNHLVADIQPRLQSTLAKGNLEPDAAAESLANAKGVAEDLKMRSELIRTAVNNGDVMIQSALYELKTGEVKFE